MDIGDERIQLLGDNGLQAILLQQKVVEIVGERLAVVLSTALNKRSVSCCPTVLYCTDSVWLTPAASSKRSATSFFSQHSYTTASILFSRFFADTDSCASVSGFARSVGAGLELLMPWIAPSKILRDLDFCLSALMAERDTRDTCGQGACVTHKLARNPKRQSGHMTDLPVDVGERMALPHPRRHSLTLS